MKVTKHIILSLSMVLLFNLAHADLPPEIWLNIIEQSDYQTSQSLGLTHHALKELPEIRAEKVRERIEPLAQQIQKIVLAEEIEDGNPKSEDIYYAILDWLRQNPTTSAEYDVMLHVLSPELAPVCGQLTAWYSQCRQVGDDASSRSKLKFGAQICPLTDSLWKDLYKISKSTPNYCQVAVLMGLVGNPTLHLKQLKKLVPLLEPSWNCNSRLVKKNRSQKRHNMIMSLLSNPKFDEKLLHKVEKRFKKYINESGFLQQELESAKRRLGLL